MKGKNKVPKEKMANLIEKYQEHSESRKDQRKILTQRRKENLQK